MGSRACLFLAIPLSPSSGYPTLPSNTRVEGAPRLCDADPASQVSAATSIESCRPSASVLGEGSRDEGVKGGGGSGRFNSFGCQDAARLVSGATVPPHLVLVLVKFCNGAVGFGRSMIRAFLRAITGWGILAFGVDLRNQFTDRHGWTSCSVPVRPCGRPALARSTLLQA
ncbi:hypothetical protein BDA96_03G189200, partial [Sorghum bicolor]